MDNPEIPDHTRKLIEWIVALWLKLKTVQVNFRKSCLFYAIMIGLFSLIQILREFYYLIDAAIQHNFEFFYIYSVVKALLLNTPLVFLLVFLHKFDVLPSITRRMKILTSTVLLIEGYFVIPAVWKFMQSNYYFLKDIDFNPFGNASIADHLWHWMRYSISPFEAMNFVVQIFFLCAGVSWILFLIGLIQRQAVQLDTDSGHTKIVQEAAKIATLTALVSIFLIVFGSILSAIKIHRDPDAFSYLFYSPSGSLQGPTPTFWLKYALSSGRSVLSTLCWAVPVWIIYQTVSQSAYPISPEECAETPPEED